MKGIFRKAGVLFLILFATSAHVEAGKSWPFTFAAAGDLGRGPGTVANLRALAASKAAFFIALGDLSYNIEEYGEQYEQGYCSWIKSIVGDLPFELISGNHENLASQRHKGGGYIGEYIKCFPDRMKSHEGPLFGYGGQYYFDYNNLARFILISPDLDLAGVYHEYAYTANHVPNANLRWLGEVIDSAKKAGISWVIVGMHKPCITIGQKGCEIGEDLMNFLIGKRVDLILQGHDHVYSRSKQLLHVQSGSFKADWVVDPSEKDGVSTYEKDKGPVLIIGGAFGQSLYNVSAKDSEAHYFSKWMGNNSKSTFGYVEYQVSREQILGRFLPVKPQHFSDAFVIRK